MAHLTSDNILLSEPTRWHIWHDPRLYRLNPNAVSLLESALTHKRFRFRPLCGHFWRGSVLPRSADSVAKLGKRRLTRNNRIGAKDLLNRCCALVAVLESMLPARAPKIVLQQNLPVAEVNTIAFSIVRVEVF